jgi:phosphoadenosine phosphosulfate reductase
MMGSNFLPGLPLSPDQLMEVAYALPLDQKIDAAIATLRSFEKIAIDRDPMGFFLAFSGGKDSVVIKELARLSGTRFSSFYNQSTIDPPEVIAFLKEHHPDVTWNRPARNLIMSMVDEPQGPPTRLARWCCQVYKEGGGEGTVRVLGVRAKESPRRARQWKQVVSMADGGFILNPILFWTDEDVWTFIKERGVPYCSLYDEGLKRIGCVGCPMAGAEGMKRDFDRWPGFRRLWKVGFDRFWAKWKGVPRLDGKPRWFEKFDTVDDLWEWWTARDWEDEDECQKRFQWT